MVTRNRQMDYTEVYYGVPSWDFVDYYEVDVALRQKAKTTMSRKM